MPATDEELLIAQARRKRKVHRSGRNMLLMLALAVVLAVIGWAVLFRLRPVIKAIPLLPLGTVLSVLLIAGIVALAGAALCAVVAVFAMSPRSPWGNEVLGVCPTCGDVKLREDIVEAAAEAGDAPRRGPRGVVTLCETRGCDYAAARVTRASDRQASGTA